MQTQPVDRRKFLTVCSNFGLASTLFPGVLWSLANPAAASASAPPATEAPRLDTKIPAAPSKPVAKPGAVTREMIASAATIAGVVIADEYKDMMLEDLNGRLESYDAIHKLKIPNSVPPALRFDPVLPGMKFDRTARPMRPSVSRPAGKAAPANIDDVAFWSVADLGDMVRRKKISSVALTEMYLQRLKKYNPVLKFVVTLTEERAGAQAREADRDLARGKYHGPLHGIPWGAKDLLAVKGYRTTWGAGGFEEQTIDEDATVVKRLDAAGAVLVAKLTLGALAQGDVWFGGMTRNPWKTDQGSSGSSAGPSSATAAGCVGFAIGSETLGSIASPSTRCGNTGLRPTFGRVPRTGAMALSWSMDKLGPICRSVEDCALVLNAIYGPDEQDPVVHDIPFNWDARLQPRDLRIGYLKADFDRMPKPDDKPEDKARRLASMKLDQAVLDVLRTRGVKLIEVKMPDLPFGAMRPLLLAEAAAAFDELTRSSRDKLLTAQGPNDWPNAFREARFIPAVEYINANRARTLGMEAMAAIFKTVDVIVAPTFSSQLLITNLTGHPAVILPNGFREDGTPTSITFFGNLFAEAQLLATARAYQEATTWHLQRPPLDAAK